MYPKWAWIFSFFDKLFDRQSIIDRIKESKSSRKVSSSPFVFERRVGAIVRVSVSRISPKKFPTPVAQPKFVGLGIGSRVKPVRNAKLLGHVSVRPVLPLLECAMVRLSGGVLQD